MNFITDTLNYHLFPVARKHHHKNKTYLTKIKSLILNYLMKYVFIVLVVVGSLAYITLSVVGIVKDIKSKKERKKEILSLPSPKFHLESNNV